MFKKWMNHHFDNEMVGHAKSLHGIASKIIDQSKGMNDGFNELGWKVLRKFLDNSEGKRVLIDLKHLSVKARLEYYQFLENEYTNEIIPLIVSRGAVNGFWTAEEMPLFDSYLEKHAYNFIASEQSDTLKNYNKIKASDIVERFMHDNAYEFLKRNF